MLAVDTNVIVRYLVQDDPVQGRRATSLFASEAALFVSATVALETDWVLGSVYGFNRDQIGEALRSIAGLPNVTVERPALFQIALDRLAEGFDFADALHLATAEDCDVFVSFDRTLAKRAAAAGAMPVRAP